MMSFTVCFSRSCELEEELSTLLIDSLTKLSLESVKFLFSRFFLSVRRAGCDGNAGKRNSFSPLISIWMGISSDRKRS